MFSFDKDKAFWIFKPKQYEISEDSIKIITEPNTDFWQRTYYGFKNDNAPSLLFKTSEKFFSFTVKTEFNRSMMYDQCGVIIYQDSDNWFKASIEYENDGYQRLGSVVTNHGYSDWATTDIDANIKCMYYRLSRRGSDYLIENSIDGKEFKQMRVFHLFKGDDSINFGIYACSPIKASFEAKFSDINISECTWEKHEG